MTADTEPVAQPAMEQLLDLAEQTRPDIDRRDLEGAILAAHDAGWTWARTLVETAQMLARGETPYDLRNACRTPWRSAPIIRKDPTDANQ